VLTLCTTKFKIKKFLFSVHTVLFTFGWLSLQIAIISVQTAFEMWWHTRRNQISSFGESDESI